MELLKFNNLPERRMANRSQLSEFMECALKTIDEWVNLGMPVLKRPTPNDKGWIFDIKACVEWKAKRDIGVMEGEIDPDTLPPREQDYYYSAQKKKLEYRKMKGELGEIAEFQQDKSITYGMIVQRMRSFPDILERNHGIDPKIAVALEKLINDMLFDIGKEIRESA